MFERQVLIEELAQNVYSGLSCRLPKVLGDEIMETSRSHGGNLRLVSMLLSLALAAGYVVMAGLFLAWVLRCLEIVSIFDRWAPGSAWYLVGYFVAALIVQGVLGRMKEVTEDVSASAERLVAAQARMGRLREDGADGSASAVGNIAAKHAGQSVDYATLKPAATWKEPPLYDRASGDRPNQ
ncbi:hypothetical protein [Ottowia sp.]|uniref:hypothetical protein n=1 Tax=Ottowia sp. TaxID=1898956 RepID=UPI0025E866CA|nr:hypothetical protein [Ottowia sp.]MBK6616282.1 hypothetical protein [Ottowia sp.]